MNTHPYLKSLILTGALGTALLPTACQTVQQHPSGAVICNKCQTVWVSTPDGSGKPGSGYYALRSTKKMLCLGCRDAMVSFIKTGKLKHYCNICGGTLDHCTDH
jgi:ribosomal protein S27E